MDSTYPARGGSLYRRLVIPLSAFVLLGSLALAVWISRLYRRDSMERFERMAATNAGFVEELRLPMSRELARKLSTILGVGVGFYTPGERPAQGAEDGWPVDLHEILATAADSKPSTIRGGGYDIAMAPLADSRHYLVLLRAPEGGLAGLGGWVLAPPLVLTAAGGCLVFFLAHRIVRPLTALTGWLPNLKHDEEPAEPIPAALSGRSDEIGQLARSLEQTHQRLLEEQERRHRSERLATLGRIATSLAHEIRNPAAAIRMHADLLAHSASRDRSASIALIGEEIDRIADLVNQWLFVARAAPPETRRHDLSELVGAVGRRLGPVLDHAGARLRTEFAGRAEIDCDRLRIEQVVRNLVLNGMQAMPAGGEIVAKVEGRDGEVELTVRDSGNGFSEEALRRFGEPFFSEREGGMGIGLTLAREVVEAHHGTITAWNPPEGGAAVCVSLPATPESNGP